VPCEGLAHRYRRRLAATSADGDDAGWTSDDGARC